MHVIHDYIQQHFSNARLTHVEWTCAAKRIGRMGVLIWSLDSVNLNLGTSHSEINKIRRLWNTSEGTVRSGDEDFLNCSRNPVNIRINPVSTRISFLAVVAYTIFICLILHRMYKFVCPVHHKLYCINSV